MNNNKKLAIGLLISGVFLFLLIMNCSSAEHSFFHPDVVATPQAPERIGNLIGNILIIDKDTRAISQIDAKNTFDNIRNTINNHTREHALAANNKVSVANGLRERLNGPDGPNVKLNDYKNLIGPGMYTVLGIPKKAHDGGGIGMQPLEGGRNGYGSHGILGDMYRYVNPYGNGGPNTSWNWVGGWRSNGNQQEPMNYGIWQTNRGSNVGSHKSSPDVSDRPWERVKLLTDEMQIREHQGRYSGGRWRDNEHRYNDLGDGINCSGRTGEAVVRPGVDCSGLEGDGGVDRFLPQEGYSQPYNDFHLWDNNITHDTNR